MIYTQRLNILQATSIAQLADRTIYGVMLELPADGELKAGLGQTSNGALGVYTTCSETRN